MAERVRVIVQGTMLGVVWGVGAAWWYGASWTHGALIGALLWGPSVFVAVPGPHAPVVESAGP